MSVLLARRAFVRCVCPDDLYLSWPRDRQLARYVNPASCEESCLQSAGILEAAVEVIIMKLILRKLEEYLWIGTD